MASTDTVLDELLARVRVLEDKTQLASLMNGYCIAGADALSDQVERAFGPILGWKG
jgi:hypothetical protein